MCTAADNSNSMHFKYFLILFWNTILSKEIEDNSFSRRSVAEPFLSSIPRNCSEQGSVEKQFLLISCGNVNALDTVYWHPGLSGTSVIVYQSGNDNYTHNTSTLDEVMNSSDANAVCISKVITSRKSIKEIMNDSTIDIQLVSGLSRVQVDSLCQSITVCDHFLNKMCTEEVAIAISLPPDITFKKNLAKYSTSAIYSSIQYRFGVLHDDVNCDLRGQCDGITLEEWTVSKFSTSSNSTPIFGGTFCPFENPSCRDLIIEEDVHCNYTFVTGDPTDSLKNKRLRESGRFLYTDRSLCGLLNKATFSTKYLRGANVSKLNTNYYYCRISVVLYGYMDVYWTLSVCEHNECRTLIKRPDLKNYKYLKTYTASTYIKSDFYLKFETGTIYTSEYIGIYGLYLSKGCMDNVFSDKESLLRRVESEASGVTKPDSPVKIIILVVTISIITVISVGAFIGRHRRYLKYSHTNTEMKALVEDLLDEKLSMTTRRTMLMEDNPNYLWYSKGLCGCITKYDSSRITVENLIGSGEFGNVYKGFVCTKAGSARIVALKELSNSAMENVMADFLLEAITLSKLDHKNIVHSYGISSDDVRSFIVLEYMEGGDMLSFLRTERDNQISRYNPRPEQLLQLALDIADGCKYLADSYFVHRDIAARNCLLTKSAFPTTAKIGDFGMARAVIMKDFYKKEGLTRVPVRWMPPESYTMGVFSTKSDVWSYGILLWEIYNLGCIPYPGFSNEKVMGYVSSGERLENPRLCPGEIYDIMVSCWSEVPGNRCSFQDIVSKLNLIKQHYVLTQGNDDQYITVLDNSPDVPPEYGEKDMFMTCV